MPKFAILLILSYLCASIIKYSFMKNITLFVALSSFFFATAQDDLIKSVAGNHSNNAGFKFTTSYQSRTY